MGFFDFLKSKEEPKASAPKKVTHVPNDVGAFYNKNNDAFLQVYGEVIQAFRTTDVTKLLDYQIESIGLQQGMKVIDAGCGVCGPACYFAEKAGVEVSAVTISEEQKNKASQKIEEKNLGGKVQVKLGDYHQLSQVFEPNSFDVVYFLESFGHSPNHAAALKSAWDVLKPGGHCYIKDLFRKVAVIPEHQPRIDQEIDKINEAYRYNIADLYHVLDEARKLGFVISFLKTIDLKVDEFENLTISNEFQDLTGIAKIDSFDDYIFPVDFFELKLYKPHFDLSNGIDRYFLQNLYYMQVHNRKESEL